MSEIVERLKYEPCSEGLQQEALDVIESLRQQLARITNMANCGTVDSFLLLSDDDKRKWFAMSVIESTRRKEAEQQLAECQEILKDHGEIQADLCRQLADKGEIK